MIKCCRLDELKRRNVFPMILEPRSQDQTVVESVSSEASLLVSSDALPFKPVLKLPFLIRTSVMMG